MQPVAIHGFTTRELCAEARRTLPRGHGVAADLHRDALLRGRFDPESFGLGPVACAAWREHFAFGLPDVARVVSEPSDRGTTAKAVLRLSDGLEIECVRIPMGRGRHTLCISSQVGCKMGCTFCETARMGLLRSLSADEIVAQYLVARHVLGWRIRNIVFMGMGEALDNAAAVIQAIRVFNDDASLSIAQERITVCTVGHLAGLRALHAAGFRRLNLSVSLNAANDRVRRELMPIHRKSSLDELQRALLAYRPRTNFALGVNYCLIPGINDSREDARGVAAFCRPLGRVLLNLIPYNPGSVPLTRPPTAHEVDRFVGWLRDDGVPVRRRVTKGRSVMAACGQLGNAELKRQRLLPR